MIIKEFSRMATALNEEINVFQRLNGYVAIFMGKGCVINQLSTRDGKIQYFDAKLDLEKLLKDNAYRGTVHYFESQSFTTIQ